MKKDMFDNRYDYYFYGVNNADIENVMSDGIEIDGSQLFGNLKKVYLNGESLDLMDKVGNFAYENNFDNVMLIKVPSYYMGWRHRNGVKESFVPLIKSYYDKSKLCVRTFVIPELIYGLYEKNSDEFRLNENYNVFFDPSGLQYSDEQIGNMYGFRCYNLQKNAFDRKMYSYDELKMYDTQSQLWVKTMEYYKSSKVKKLILNINKNSNGRR